MPRPGQYSQIVKKWNQGKEHVKWRILYKGSLEKKGEELRRRRMGLEEVKEQEDRSWGKTRYIKSNETDPDGVERYKMWSKAYKERPAKL